MSMSVILTCQAIHLTGVYMVLKDLNNKHILKSILRITGIEFDNSEGAPTLKKKLLIIVRNIIYMIYVYWNMICELG